MTVLLILLLGVMAMAPAGATETELQLPGVAAPDTVRMRATADSTDALYATMQVEALRSYCAGSASEFDRLRCQYRLYPLTREADLLDGLPSAPEGETPENLALLSGLWGYRASTSGFPRAIRHGMRSQRLIDRASELDAENPFVLLVEGQALLFKPRAVGGDRAEAALRFSRLAEQLKAAEAPPILLIEAQTWHWYALALEGDPSAEALRQSLLAQNPPPLFLEMLSSPP